MSENAIEVRGLSKKFTIVKREDKLKNLLVDLLHGRSRPPQVIQALKDITFNVKKGEFFGVIGRNGSGKSTLLKVLAGVYSPDVGEVRIDGRLTPFIELGVGFNPDLSGRDNVFLNGALLGFSHKEMEGMYDEIVGFAELEQFMDQRLKNYSSGMQVRLAFSIAVQAKADILLIDEVLAVGDANFQQKCLQKFHEFKKQGKTIVFVSHSMEMVEKFCDRVLVLHDGRGIYKGRTGMAISKYESLNQEGRQNSQAKDTQPSKTNQAKIVSAKILDEKGQESRIIHSLETFQIEVCYQIAKPLPSLSLSIRLCEAENRMPLVMFNSEDDGFKPDTTLGTHLVRAIISPGTLQLGRLYVNVDLCERGDQYSDGLFYDTYHGDHAGDYFLIKDTLGKKNSSGIIDISRKWAGRALVKDYSGDEK